MSSRQISLLTLVGLLPGSVLAQQDTLAVESAAAFRPDGPGVGASGAASLTTASGLIAIGSFWGDANLDDKIDIFDVVILAGYVVGSVAPGQAPFLGTSVAMNLKPTLG